MLIRRPQSPSWNQPNPSPSPLLPKRWLDQDSGGAVGLGIVAALHKSIIVNSPLKFIVSTTPMEITSLRPAVSRRHGHNEKRWRDDGYFCQSLPVKLSNKQSIVTAADFLSHCSLCGEQLHQKDVYMYQEKAFCSTECRYQQIVSDERQEKSRRSKMMKNSCSPCSSELRYEVSS